MAIFARLKRTTNTKNRQWHEWSIYGVRMLEPLEVVPENPLGAGFDGLKFSSNLMFTTA